MISSSKLSTPFEAYTAESITKKNVNREIFVQQFGLAKKPKSLLVGIYIDNLDKAQMDIVNILSEAATHIPYIDIVVVGQKAPIVLSEENTAQVFSGLDVMLFLHNDTSKIGKIVGEMHRFGVVSVANVLLKEDGMLTEYNPYKERGETFFFQEENEWNILANLIRVHEVFKFPYDWNTIRRNAMQNS